MPRYWIKVTLLVACGKDPSTPPAVVSAEPRPAATVPTAVVDASVPGAVDASVAVAVVDAAPPDAGIACGSTDPRMSACKWSVEMLPMCTAGMGNVPANYQERRPHCRCDGCKTDTDCAARKGGRCVPLTDTCYTENVCVYPEIRASA